MSEIFIFPNAPHFWLPIWSTILSLEPYFEYLPQNKNAFDQNKRSPRRLFQLYIDIHEAKIVNLISFTTFCHQTPFHIDWCILINHNLESSKFSDFHFINITDETGLVTLIN